MSAPPAPRPRMATLLPVLAFASAVGLIASSIYIPSIPAIARDLGSGVGPVQLTLTVFLIAFAFAMLLHGPLSDRYGRKPVMIGGMVVGGIGSLGCGLSGSVEALLVWRVVQALGVCTGMTISRAILRDLFTAEEARRPMSLLAVAAGIAPAAAPSIGGLMEVEFGWRSQFYLMAGYCAVLCLVIGFGMAESNRHLLRDRSLFGGMTSSFRQLLTSRAFLYYTGTITCGASAFFIYTVGVPVALAAQYDLRPDIIGLYTGIPPLGFIAISSVMARFGNRLPINTFVRIGSVGLALTGLLLAALAVGGVSDPLLLCGPGILIGISNGMMMPSAFAGSVNVNPRIAGAASGLSGFLQMMAGAGATAYAAALPQHSMIPLMASLAVLGLAAAAIAWFMQPRG